MADAAPEDSERLLALLESQHSFPGPYTFKIIFRNQPALGESIVAAIVERVPPQRPPDAPKMRSSSSARFVSMSLELELAHAREVLEVYSVLGTLESVIQYF